MYKLRLLKSVSGFVLLGALASCGGGGAATGGLTEFSVVPNEWTLTFPKGNTVCAVNPSNYPSVTLTIVGGTPPYRIVNSNPQTQAVSANSLDGKNPTLTVFHTGGCGDSLGILILDSLSRTVNFSATYEAGEELEADPAAPA